MKTLLLLLFFTANTFAKTPQANNIPHPLAFQAIILPVVVTPTPFKPMEKEEYNTYVKRIITLSNQYQKESIRYLRNRPNPMHMYIFTHIPPYTPENGQILSGYCDQEKKLIYLNPNFNEFTFYHELGHCDLGYAHKEDTIVTKKGFSKYIMNWKFNAHEYGLSRQESLSQFFNPHDHVSLNSPEGQKAHHAMTSQIESFENKQKNMNEISQIVKKIVLEPIKINP